MPAIFFYGPELEKEKRKALISFFTEKASELTGIDEKAFTVYLKTCDPGHVGVGGKLLEERLQE